MDNDYVKPIKNYNLSKGEEINLINYINDLLIEFENHLELFSIDSSYFSIIPLGRKICQTMLELLIKKEGYSINENMDFVEIINLANDKHIIRRKYYYTLNIIETQTNEALCGVETKFGKYINFLKLFSEFINCINLNFQKIFFINNITLKINSILEDSNYTHIKPNKKPLIVSKYKFTISEEVENIRDINKLLKDYEKQLKIISSEKKFYYTFLGSTITELMLKLLLKKERMYFPNENYAFNKYAEILYKYKIIPEECENFIKQIGRYQNEFIQGKKQSNKLVLSFLKAFNYFIQWFDNYYFENYNNNFQIEGCCELINSITYDEQNKILKFIEKDENPDLKVGNQLKINEFQTAKLGIANCVELMYNCLPIKILKGRIIMKARFVYFDDSTQIFDVTTEEKDGVLIASIQKDKVNENVKYIDFMYDYFNAKIGESTNPTMTTSPKAQPMITFWSTFLFGLGF